METERTPLIQGSEPFQTRNATSVDDEAARTQLPDHENGLPALQIFLLCYARVVDPIAFYSIFPYIGEMVHRVGRVLVSDVGFYSGLVESLFAIAQTSVLILWSSLADRFGRKPVLICSLAGTTIGPVLFGLSTALWQMLFFRTLAGFLAASNLVIRTMTSDISTAKTQASAFAWLAFATNVGNFLGPIIGGTLANPAGQYPNLFGENKLFRAFPYVLPGLFIGGISATAAVASILGLKETQKDARGSRSVNVPSMSLAQLIKAPGVPTVLCVYVYVMLLAVATAAILPVYLYTPVSLGGLGLTTLQISIYTAIQGAGQALWLLLLFPFLQRRLGTKKLLRVTVMCYPCLFLGYMLMNITLRNTSGAARILFWIIVPVMLLFGPSVVMSHTGVQLALNDASPDPIAVGKLNAIALTGNGVVRAVVPGLATVIFAVGVRNEIVLGNLAWIVLILLSIALCVLVHEPADDMNGDEEEEQLCGDCCSSGGESDSDVSVSQATATDYRITV